MTFTPSHYQKAIFDLVWSNSWQHIMVNACAGSGKTTTGIKTYDFFPQGADIMFTAFNKSIQMNLSAKGVTAMTYHSMGFKAIRDAYGNVQVDTEKTSKILKNYIDPYREGFLIPPIRKLVSLCKNYLILEPTDDELWELAAFHNVDLYPDQPELADTIFDAARFTVKKSAEIYSFIDYDDMISLPLFTNLPMHRYDILIVDEFQDTNKAQAEEVCRSGERILGLGDPNQAIYGFRGADTEAMPNMTKRLNATEMPLSITYRNPLAVVKLVNQRYPNIKIEAADWAIEGNVSDIAAKQFLDTVQPGDMSLCRTNAPMVEYVFQLLRQGRKALVLGKDIGQGLVSLIKKMKTNDLPDFYRNLRDYVDRETYKFIMSDKQSLATALIDKRDCILAMSEGCASVDELTNRIQSIFSDDKEGIVFSSIHKAKGLEAKNVFILHPELIPHPMAKKPWERKQEENIGYVANTRSLENLTFVQG